MRPNTWLNGYIDRRVTVHEQGHNYGLSHSHSYLCTQVITGTCTWSDYGDDFDAMGASGLVGHFCASQKDMLGWMDGRIVDLTSGGQATLAPIAKDALAISCGRHPGIARPVVLAGVPTDGSTTTAGFRSPRPTASWSTSPIRPLASGDSSNLVDTRPADGLHPNTATLKPGRLVAHAGGLHDRRRHSHAHGAVVTVVGPRLPGRRLRAGRHEVPSARRVGVPSTETHAFCDDGDRRPGEVRRHRGSNSAPRDAKTSVPDVDTVFKLYASDGTTLAHNDDFKSGLASRIDFTPETDGTYFLMVRQFDG